MKLPLSLNAMQTFYEDQIVVFLCYCSQSGSIGRGQINIKVIYSLLIFPSAWLCCIYHLLWLYLCESGREHWVPAGILFKTASKTTPTMSTLPFTTQHTVVSNSTVISKCKTKELILIIEPNFPFFFFSLQLWAMQLKWQSNRSSSYSADFPC